MGAGQGRGLTALCESATGNAQDVAEVPDSFSLYVEESVRDEGVDLCYAEREAAAGTCNFGSYDPLLS